MMTSMRILIKTNKKKNRSRSKVTLGIIYRPRDMAEGAGPGGVETIFLLPFAAKSVKRHYLFTLQVDYKTGYQGFSSLGKALGFVNTVNGYTFSLF